MSKKVQYYQLVRDRDDVCGISWPDGSGTYAAKHPIYRVIETKDISYVLFTDDMLIPIQKFEEFVNKLKNGGLICVLVDLESASNPISQRKPAMNKVRQK